MRIKAKKARGVRVMLAALMLCMGALLFPVAAHAQTVEKDTTPPTLTAELSGDDLAVAASDDLSGVQGIYVDGRRITTLVNGAATVKLKDYHGNGKEVAVYAMDNAGNKSQPVKFPNPHYQAPASLPPASVPAPVSSAPAPSSSQPTASSSSSAPASSSSDASSSSTSTQQPGASQPQSSSSSTTTAVPDSTSGSGFTPDGTGTVQDNATEEDGKEFFTITTADGNVFYLVVDRQRGQENVYFLNAVTEADLLALADAGVVPGETAIPAPVEPQPDNSDASEPDSSEPTEPGADKDSGGGVGTILFILIAALAVGGAGWYFKIYRPKQQSGGDADDGFDDLDDGEDDYGLVEDDEPPFDLDDDPDIGADSDMDDEAGRNAYEQADGFGDDGE